MGLIKWIVDKFSCKSSCQFNIENEVFDFNLHKMSLDNFELKHKDILKIHRILNKRDIKPRFPKNSII